MSVIIWKRSSHTYLRGLWTLSLTYRMTHDQALTLRYLLNDLLAWGNRPEYLIPMAYQWCSAISKKIRERGGDELVSTSWGGPTS
jgi:hypothetical protein